MLLDHCSSRATYLFSLRTPCIAHNIPLALYKISFLPLLCPRVRSTVTAITVNTTANVVICITCSQSTAARTIGVAVVQELGYFKLGGLSTSCTHKHAAARGGGLGACPSRVIGCSDSGFHFRTKTYSDRRLAARQQRTSQAKREHCISCHNTATNFRVYMQSTPSPMCRDRTIANLNNAAAQLMAKSVLPS